MRGVAKALVVAALCALLPQGAAARCEDHIPQPPPQNASRDIVGQSLDRIIERGTMSFALYRDLPPWSWESGGQPQGIDVEIARLIAADLGVTPQFRFVASAETLEADLRYQIWRGGPTGGAVSNAMMHVPYDSNFACRVEQVVFTGQAYRERLAIAYRDTAYPDAAPTPAFFRFAPVGVENDTISDFFLTSFARGRLRDQIRRFPDSQDAMAALALGEIDAVMGPRGQLEHGQSAGIVIHEPPLPGLAVGDWTVGLAVHFSYRPLGYAVDDAILAAIEDGRIPALFAARGLTYEPPER